MRRRWSSASSCSPNCSPIRRAHLAFSTHIDGDGDAAYALASEQQFEGIISKRADQPYHPGRGDDWRKTKHLQSEEFAVVGYTPGKGNRGGFGSLLLARPDPAWLELCRPRRFGFQQRADP